MHQIAHLGTAFRSLLGFLEKFVLAALVLLLVALELLAPSAAAFFYHLTD